MNRRINALLAPLAATLLVASIASAQATFSLTGKAATGAGPDVRLPAIGATPCTDIKGYVHRPDMAPQTYTPVFTTGEYMTLNKDGCIPGPQDSVMTNGTGGFMIPQGFFSAPVTGELRVVAVPLTPMVVQLATSFNFSGPNMYSAPYEALNAAKYDPTTAPYAVWNNFRHGAWTTHTGRVGSNFTACAAMNPATVHCTFPSQGGTPLNTLPAIIKNIGSGGGGFGGTMGLVITTGTDNISSLGIAIGGGQILVNYLAGMGSRAAGRGYAVFDTDNLIGGTIWNMYKLTNCTDGPSIPTNCQTDTMYQVIGMVTNAVAPGGAGLNRNYGFPWTDGTIIVRGTGETPLGNSPAGGSFSIQGYDNRTTMGAGNIQLVAGHLSKATIQGPNGTANYSVLRLPEPDRAVPLVAGAVALLGLAAWRARRSR